PMEFITEIAKQSEKHEGALMTIAQQIEQMGIQKGKLEGMQEGIQKGKLEGIQEGEKQASLKIARQMLESGMDRQSVMKFTSLTDSELKKLFKD
ncbi:MAG TPA: ISNCY family transposase, partial [Arsenophonus apicola]